MSTHYVALTGKAGSGKSTLAKAVVDLMNISSKPGNPLAAVFSFAQPLRVEVSECLISNKWPKGFPLKDIEIPKDKPKDPNVLWKKPTEPWVRQLLQRYGAWRKKKDDEYWVSHVSWPITKAYKLVVFDDLRFDVEAKKIRSLGGVVFQLLSDRQDPNVDYTHPSEQGVSPEYVDLCLETDRPLPDLVEWVYHLSKLPTEAIHQIRSEFEQAPIFSGILFF